MNGFGRKGLSNPFPKTSQLCVLIFVTYTMSDEPTATSTPTSAASKSPAPTTNTNGSSKGKRQAASNSAAGAAGSSTMEAYEQGPEAHQDMIRALQAKIAELESKAADKRASPAPGPSSSRPGQLGLDNASTAASEASEAQVQELQKALAQVIDAIEKTPSTTENTTTKRPRKGDLPTIPRRVAPAPSEEPTGGASRPSSKKPSIFSIPGLAAASTPVTIQGEAASEPPVPPLHIDTSQRARFTALAEKHFTTEQATLISAMLDIRDNANVLQSAIAAICGDEEMQQQGVTAHLSPAETCLSNILTTIEDVLATISRQAFMQTCKIDPKHMKLLELCELNNALNPSRAPMSMSDVRNLLGLESLSNKIADKDNDQDKSKSKNHSSSHTRSATSSYLRATPFSTPMPMAMPMSYGNPVGVMAGAMPMHMYPPGPRAGGMGMGGGAPARGGGAWPPPGPAGGTAANPALLPDQCRRCGVRGHFARFCPLNGAQP